MPAKRHELTAVGQLLVSYEARELPTDTLERLAKETLEDPEISPAKALIVCGWLLRIAVQKLRALEEEPAHV